MNIFPDDSKMKTLSQLCYLYAKNNYCPSAKEELDVLQRMIINQSLKLTCRQKIAEAIIEQER